jgi:hypothetical protein
MQLSLTSGSYGQATSNDACYAVDLMGNVNQASSMPDFRVLAALAPLPDGRVLLTGGAIADTNPFQGINSNTGTPADVLSATNSAWIYDPNSDAWTATGAMSVRRGGHEARSLPDGRVLVVGGFSTISDLFLDLDDGIACAEVYDPREGTFTVLDATCGVGSLSGDLAGQTVFPLVISDDIYGTLVVGGIDGNLNAIDDVALYAPAPQ